MDNITALETLDWWELFFGIVLTLVCVVYIVNSVKKVLNIFGKERIAQCI